MHEREWFGQKENTTLKTNRGRQPYSTTSSLAKFGFFLGVPSSTYEQAHEQHNNVDELNFCTNPPRSTSSSAGGVFFSCCFRYQLRIFVQHSGSV